MNSNCNSNSNADRPFRNLVDGIGNVQRVDLRAVRVGFVSDIVIFGMDSAISVYANTISTISNAIK